MRTLVAIVLLTSAAAAQSPSAQEWRSAGIVQAGKVIDWYEENIRSAEADLGVIQKRTEFQKDAEPHFGSSDGVRHFICENKLARQVYIEMLERRIADLKDKRFRAFHWIEPELESLQVGQFGYVVTTDVSTARSNLLSQPEKMSRAERLYSRYLEDELLVRKRQVSTAEVFQVLGADSMLVKYRGDVVKVEGVSTEGMTNGGYMAFTEPMIVKGTTTYAAAIGTNTVFVLAPIQKSQQAKLDASVTDEDRNPFESRTWQDISGKFSIDAELADFDGKTVTLRKKDGTKLDVPFAKLSKADKDFVKEQLGAP